MERNRRKESKKHNTVTSKNNISDLSNICMPRYCSQYAISINPFNPYNILQIRENQGTERLSDFPKVPQLIKNGNWI